MYCSVLPKNCLMERENVIQIWVAQGLINSLSNEQTLEATRDLYFNFLLQTSLLGEPGYDDFANVKTCKMHDLVHDFASHISRDYCSNMNLGYVTDATEVEVVDPSVNFQRLRALHLLPEKFINLKNLSHVYGYLHIPRMGELVNLQTLPSLTVNGEKGFGMQELETLDNLKGKLISYDIQNVMSREEASRSNLSRKFGISILELHWDLYMKGKCSPNELLEVLKPHSNLTVLSITGFSGHTFPSWMVASNHLRNLVRIKLRSCDHCVEVLALRHLPNLQLVEIHGMDYVKCIGPEFYGLNELDSTAAVFPSLRKLSLCMPNLEKWPGVRNSSLSSPRIVFPRIQELILDLCRSLTDLPETDCFHSLSHLTISNCCKLVSLPNWIQGLVSIENFTLSDGSLNYLPEMNNLVSLQIVSITFFIHSCYILNALPELSNVSALRKLDISGCLNIVSFPNVPSGLHSLRIDCCRRIKVIPAGLEACNFLEKVCITGCSSLESLDGLQHLSNLKRLEIGEFLESLDYFPWQILFHFQNLESLKLIGWSRLKSLPDLQRLPALRELIIENFNMLEVFTVWDCPLLKERCDGSGPECHKISHIPSIGILDGF
ncbi:hypothetical protein LIER_38845 [Lithospermum erythrorhizon]|uniref:Uncharacterized protein n=1 Tax=Lithospermum erythrorhizon TaxID=34254 RepID=A0AAV3QA44_LITER